MSFKSEWKTLFIITAVFFLFLLAPFDSVRIIRSVSEALQLTAWYAREHVVLCLLPAFFIAGAISTFISQASVMRYLGPQANKFMAYGVSAVAGNVLAVCSCTVLPLFAGIYKMGAGIGPATTFLYSGPAINVLAIILTARVLGLELGIARVIGAVLFSVVIGLSMQFIFRKDKTEEERVQMVMPDADGARPLWKTALYFFAMIAILVFANWGKPPDGSGFFGMIHNLKWVITGVLSVVLWILIILWFNVPWLKTVAGAIPVVISIILFPEQHTLNFGIAVISLSVILATTEGESSEWFRASWDFAKQIMPLLFWGILVAGALLGRPGEEGLIPSEWINAAVGGNSLRANMFASVAGAFMYFATLTEVPILQGLIGNGMGKGPALALLLAGPALSLPNMLVIRSVMGMKKTVVFVVLVVVMATISGVIYGNI